MYLFNSLAKSCMLLRKYSSIIKRDNIFELTYYKLSLIQTITAWYSLFLNKSVFQENKLCNFKIHLFSILNTKQTNDGTFSNKAGENFNMAKIS